MAKRIQMRKQRFTAVQKMAAEKKIQIEVPTVTPGPEPLPPPRTSTLTRPAPPSRSSVTNYLFYFLILFFYILNSKIYA